MANLHPNACHKNSSFASFLELTRNFRRLKTAKLLALLGNKRDAWKDI